MIEIDSASVLHQFSGTAADSAPIKLLGIRGYFLAEGVSGENDFGIYDDLLCVAINGKVEAFRGSTDPGRYYLDNPLNDFGCAVLRLGLWNYRLGRHRDLYPAFIQSGEVTVDRVTPDGKAVKRESGYFGINIHSGGPETHVGRYSAGCQIIWCPDGAWGDNWQAFYHPVATAMKASGQVEVPYLLVDSFKAVSPSKMETV